MAHKRMFSKTIIETDAFQDMSQTAQLLYFYLNMQADDDGFVGNPKKIMRSGGFAEDDMKILLAKRFLLAFENGVVVIKHWLIHNTIRKDRYIETSYKKEKEMLLIKENKAYTDNGNQMATNGLPSIDIGEDRRDIDIATKVAIVPFNSKEWIEQCCADKQPHIQLIGNYMKIKKMDFPTKKTAEAELHRNMKVATLLKDYPPERRKKALVEANKMTKQWTLETILKYLNK